MSNVREQNKPSDIAVEEVPFVTQRMVLHSGIHFSGQRYSHPDLAQYHTRVVNVYGLINGDVAIFSGDCFICMAKPVPIKPNLNPLKIRQRVIVKKTGFYGVVNHQCSFNSFYLVRLDGEINLRSFSAAELKKGDQQ